MTPISEANFVVVDVETTGSDPARNRITDIGCIVVRNFSIVRTFASLIKTRQHIPRYIQKMTGITNEMVATAPEASEVFEIVKNILSEKNSFFVAHNSVFDWSFVNESIKRNKLQLNAVPNICTLKLARKTLPAGIKKNVGALAEFFNIPIQNRHRAFDDANATAHFFIELLYILQNNFDVNYVEELIEFQNAKQKHVRKLGENIIAKLNKYKQSIPPQMGLLMFIGQNGDVLQVFHANNIKSYLDFLIEQANNAAKKVKQTLQQFHRIEWIETNNELETKVMAYRKIMQLSPLYNTYVKQDIYNQEQLLFDNTTKKGMSMAIIMQNSDKEKTIDVYFIREGGYAGCITVGRKASLDKLFDFMQATFFGSDSASTIYIEETNIIKQWLLKYEPILLKIELEAQNMLEFWTEIENAIRSFYNEESN